MKINVLAVIQLYKHRVALPRYRRHITCAVRNAVLKSPQQTTAGIKNKITSQLRQGKAHLLKDFSSPPSGGGGSDSANVAYPVSWPINSAAEEIPKVTLLRPG